MTEQHGTQGPQWPLPDDEQTPAGSPQQGEQDEVTGEAREQDAAGSARPMSERTFVFGTPHLGGSASPTSPSGPPGPPVPRPPPSAPEEAATEATEVPVAPEPQAPEEHDPLGGFGGKNITAPRQA